MAEARRVLFLRHGQTCWNLEKRFQGQTDIPLDDTGRAQAQRAARLLAALRPDAIAASDLQRAAETAGYLGEATGLTPEADKGLRERHGGSWEGLTRDEIRDRWPEQNARMDIPDGEDITEVGARVRDAVLRHLDRVGEGGLLVAVGHGAAIRAGINTLLGLPAGMRQALGPLGNCSWSLLGPLYDGNWRLLEHNASSLPADVIGDDR